MALGSFNFNFAPLLPEIWIIVLCILAGALLVLSAWAFRRGVIWRSIAAALVLLTLLNPSITQEERQPIKDVAVIIADRSTSQNFANRTQQTDDALSHIRNTLGGRDNLDLRIIEAGQDDNDLNRETKLFAALNSALEDVPPSRRAGAILITDGQVHDAPAQITQDYGPLHTLLTGEKDEFDRRIDILNAPSYGITGDTVSVTFQITDTKTTGPRAPVNLINQDGQRERLSVRIGEPKTIDLPLTHSGQNIFELSTPQLDGEMTYINNTATILVNGVRDRLKVLLVSGKPHIGGRIWRNLLTSDPGVDLVHFTILRDPTQRDNVPQNELSLIAFPFRELFDVKLYDFDLIVMDQYQLNRVLPPRYFENIKRYVEEGGALLHAAGPVFAVQDLSIYDTALGDILPGAPNGSVLENAFPPALTSLGQSHPVTRDLAAQSKSWGVWERQIPVRPSAGADILMTGKANDPLLLLERVGEGRIAQIASDQIWLWAKGYDGGGPHTELLRRTAHWLMKEPELDERAMTASVSGNTITLRYQNFDNNSPQVTMSEPDGSQQDLIMKDNGSGWLQTQITVTQSGVHSFENADNAKRFVVVGETNPPELQNLQASADTLRPLAEQSNGQILWLSDKPRPTLRMVNAAQNSTYGGASWLGLRANGDYTVTGAQQISLLPPWISVFLLLGIFLLMWVLESRNIRLFSKRD